MKRRHQRREVSPFTSKEGDVDVVALGDVGEREGELEVAVLVEGVEFLGGVERDNGDAVGAVVDEDGGLGGHGGWTGTVGMLRGRWGKGRGENAAQYNINGWT